MVPSHPLLARRGLLVVAASATLFACTADVGPGSDYWEADDEDDVAGIAAGLTKGSGGVNGDGDFCDDPMFPCASGEGDCDGGDGAQCQSGLTCIHNVGAKFGFASGTDICLPAHCGNGAQDSGSGETGIDCGGPCGTCLTCGTPPPNGTADSCTTVCTCASGGGDCDGDASCDAGLVCGNGIGQKFGMPAGYDVCVPAHCVNATMDGDETGVDCGGSCGSCSTMCSSPPPNGTPDSCTSTCPCAAGGGDCDLATDCQSGLVCKRAIGALFGMPASYDVCVPAHCTNGALDAVSGEEEIDCGGPCGSCRTARLSKASDGTQGNSDSYATWGASSDDGQVIAFASRATNFAVGDTGASVDIFVRDRGASTTTWVTVDGMGMPGNGHSRNPVISANGRLVVFESDAPNLVTGDTNAARDIFVYDRMMATTIRVSVDSSGAEGNGTSYRSAISGDGTVVAFVSAATNLVAGDTNAQHDVFVHVLATGVTSRVSVATGGGEANSFSGWPSLSTDGRYVAFDSEATNLVAGDANGVRDVFRHDRTTTTTVRASVSSGGAEGNGVSRDARVSGDGSLIVFQSDASNLVGSDGNGATDAFLRDVGASSTTRVSTSTSGAEGNGASTLPSISRDGAYVGFLSAATNLVSGDTNGAVDVFVKNLASGALVRNSIRSDGAQGNRSSSSVALDADGSEVVYTSASTTLVGGDTNNQPDVFASPRL